MQVTVIAPSPALARFVDRFTIVESAIEVTRALLPEPGLVLGLRYRGAASVVDGERITRVADLGLTGLLGHARRMRTAPGSGVVLAMFRPTGAASLFRTPLHELFGRTISLDSLLPRAAVARLGDQIANQPDHRQRVGVLERFLLAHVSDEPPDPIAAAAIHAIHRARGSLRIAALARELGISQDPLEKRFRRAIGASPKQVASLVRLRHAIAAGQAGATWSRVAHEAGYFDQSHFIREFRAFTGASPAKFFRTDDYC
ncbi:MAG: helix-turn-helix domain-containing protein [Kofleriaceae bacterium]